MLGVRVWGLGLETEVSLKFRVPTGSCDNFQGYIGFLRFHVRPLRGYG